MKLLSFQGFGLFLLKRLENVAGVLSSPQLFVLSILSWTPCLQIVDAVGAFPFCIRAYLQLMLGRFHFSRNALFLDVYWQIATYVAFFAEATQVAASVLVLILTFFCSETSHVALFHCSTAVISYKIFTF